MAASKAVVVRDDELRPDDVVIAVVGPCGTGKSTFIQHASGFDLHAGGDLKAKTYDFTAYRITPEDRGGQSPIPDLILIDTPGYDNEYAASGSTDLLRQLYARLGSGIQLSGIIYMYGMFDNSQWKKDRPVTNIELFQNLCGPEAFSRVILTTTMWGDRADKDMLQVEEDLKHAYWGPMIQQGSRIMRFDNKPSSAWTILTPIIAKALHTRWVRYYQEFELNNFQHTRHPAGQQLINAAAMKVKEKRTKIDKIARELEKGIVKPESLRALMECLRDLEDQGSGPRVMDETAQITTNARGTSVFDRLWARVGPGLRRRPTIKEFPQRIVIQCQEIALEIANNVDKVTESAVNDLKGGDAQTMVNYLDQLLVSRRVDSKEGRQLLSMLCRLATSSCVFPLRYQVDDSTFPLDTPIQTEDGHSTVRKINYKGKVLRCKISKGAEGFSRKNSLLKMHLKEIILWAHLSNPNLLPFSGVYVTSETRKICALAPWMENGNIRQYAGGLSSRERLPLLADLSDGLYYLHGSGLLHGNLKGSNILVSDDGRAMIAEFGFGNFASNPITIDGGSPMITPNWTAPELFEGYNKDEKKPRHPTQLSDIWSFGCVIYEIMSLRDPYYHLKQRYHLLLSLINHELPRRSTAGDDGYVGPNTIDDDVWKVITTLLIFEPEGRPNSQTVREVVHQLQFRDNRSTKAGQSGDVDLAPTPIDFERVHRLLLEIKTAPSSEGSDSYTPCPTNLG